MTARIQDEQGIFSRLLASPATQPAVDFTCACSECAQAGQAGNDLGAYGTTPTADTYNYVAQAALPASGGSLAALMAGSKWTSVDSDTAKTVVSFSFINPATSTFSYGSMSNFTSSAAAFGEADKQLTRELLGKIAEVCNIEFIEVADNAAECGVLRYGYSQEPNAMSAAGYAFFPSSSALGGDIWIGANQATATWDFYRPNLILHETLHALGLKHPFAEGAVLSTQQDIIPNTVMSYSAVAGGTKGYMDKYPSEPMGLDVAALQQLYGATILNNGDTRYNLASSDWQDGFHALWDSGGNDTLDASGVSRGVSINLESGTSSNIGAGVNAHATVAGVVQNVAYNNTLTLTKGVQIENAVGSAFGDVLDGNSLDNRLEGRGGNDQLNGGWGMDTAVYAGARASFHVAQGSGFATVQDVTGAQGTDVLTGIERIEFSSGKIALDLDGNAGKAAELLGVVFGAGAVGVPQYVGQALGMLDAGVPFDSLMQMALDMRLGSNPSDAAVVNLLYTNVSGHAPGASDAQPYIAMLQSGAATHASLAVMIAETDLNADHIGLTGLAATGLDYV